MATIETRDSKKLHVNKPEWLKTKIPTGETLFRIKKELRERKLFTVCEEAKCPNISQCWSAGTSTFMILGDTCTRACRFCHVKTGDPGGLLDRNEPKKTAEAIKLMGLDYAVITMVDRDDLPDFGAAHIAQVFYRVREASPSTKIEFLGGDMGGDAAALEKILSTEIEVFAHNVETVERLSPRVRDARAGYRQSLDVLKFAKDRGHSSIMTKSAVMMGLGETRAEIISTLHDLREHGVDLVTIGQYMRPTKRHLSIKEFIAPEMFDEIREEALALGFLAVSAGPLVRSSYLAGESYRQAIKKLAESRRV